MTDEEWEQRYLSDLRRHAGEARSLYSNAQKTERERMVVRAFLRCVGVSFSESDVKVGTEEPVDVSFGDANFQVMTILDGRRPQQEWKDKEKKWRTANTVEDVMEPWVEPAPLSLAAVSCLVADELKGKASHYADRSNVDMLVYIDVPDQFLSPRNPLPDPNAIGELKRQGWCSVSFVMVPYGGVLLAEDEAPAFLREKVGKIWRAWESPDGLFDP